MNKDVSLGQPIVRHENGRLFNTTDQYATEFPLTIMVNGEEFVTVIYSPINLEELAIGFLASEGAILKRDELRSVLTDDSKGSAHAKLNKNLGDRFQYSTKRMIASCCGKSHESHFQNDVAAAKTSMPKITLTPQQVTNMTTCLQSASHIYQKTGDLRNATISDGLTFSVHRQDIGRHNIPDRLYGFCIQRHTTVRDKVLIFSGRIPLEVLIKAAKIGVGATLSKSALTMLTVTSVNDLNTMVVGLIRSGGFNIYSHPGRTLHESTVQKHYFHKYK